MKGEREEFENGKPPFQAQLLLTLLSLGFTQFNNAHWGTMRSYWQDLSNEAKKDIQTALTAEWGQKNPGLLRKAGEHLWAKPSTTVTLPGQKPKKAQTLIKDFNEAKIKIAEYFAAPESKGVLKGSRAFQKWANEHLDENLRNDETGYNAFLTWAEQNIM